MFFLLRKYCKQRALLGAAISNDGEDKRDDGLVAGHAYSVLDCRSFKDKGSPGGRHSCNASDGICMLRVGGGALFDLVLSLRCERRLRPLC